MFEHLNKYNSIIVSGPQRAGTRITAKILANDTDKSYIDEELIAFHDTRLLEWYLSKGNVVIQCPGLCHLLQRFKIANVLVVVVRRDIEDILKSEARCWDEGSKKIELFKYGYSSGIISKIKYDFWDTVQKSYLGEQALDINYKALKDHKLFIADRNGFRWNQTQ